MKGFFLLPLKAAGSLSLQNEEKPIKRVVLLGCNVGIVNIALEIQVCIALNKPVTFNPDHNPSFMLFHLFYYELFENLWLRNTTYTQIVLVQYPNHVSNTQWLLDNF